MRQFAFQIKLILIGIVLFVTCKKQEETLPVLTTENVNTITTTTANCGGNIIQGANITARGICWSTNPNPTIADNAINEGAGTGSFTSSLTGLATNATYYIRAYATNAAGTSYGKTVMFTTLRGTAPDTVTDIDGNLYNTVTIGTQVWMKENLKTTKYRNGDLIGTTTPATKSISSENSPQYQWAYAGVDSNVVDYGRLYTWYVIMDDRNVCPAGWHIPTDTEWLMLGKYLSGEFSTDGIPSRKMKEAGTSHWNYPNDGATNESQFTGLPGGIRYDNGYFADMKDNGYWWSSSERDIQDAYEFHLDFSNTNALRDYYDKDRGLSVRCIME